MAEGNAKNIINIAIDFFSDNHIN